MDSYPLESLQKAPHMNRRRSSRRIENSSEVPEDDTQMQVTVMDEKEYWSHVNQSANCPCFRR